MHLTFSLKGTTFKAFQHSKMCRFPGNWTASHHFVELRPGMSPCRAVQLMFGGRWRSIYHYFYLRRTKHTFVGWVLGFLSASYQCQIVTPEQHLHMADPAFQELWNSSSLVMNISNNKRRCQERTSRLSSRTSALRFKTLSARRF